ncbi:hypothetical protein F4703DRAFT_1897049 [Phycomyces blakesleeanus]
MSTSCNDSNGSLTQKQQELLDIYCQGATEATEDQITYFSYLLICPRSLISDWFYKRFSNLENKSKNKSKTQDDSTEQSQEQQLNIISCGLQEGLMTTMRKSRDFSQKISQGLPNKDSDDLSPGLNSTKDKSDLCKKYFNSVLAIVLNAAKYSIKGPVIELVQSLRDGIMTQTQLTQFMDTIPFANDTIQRMGILGVMGSTDIPEILNGLADYSIVSETIARWLVEASNVWYISTIVPMLHILDHIPFKWTSINNANLKSIILDISKKASRISEVLQKMPGNTETIMEDNKGNFYTT